MVPFISSVFVTGQGNRLSVSLLDGVCFPGCPRFFAEQNRILWATLPIKLGIPENPEVLVLRIAPDR